MEILLMDSKEGFSLFNNNEPVGKIVWTLQNDVMIMNGTYVDTALRGQNAGELLLDEAAKFARENGYKMQAVCPYVVKMFERVDKYDDVKI